jgi:hypothetical protein
LLGNPIYCGLRLFKYRHLSKEGHNQKLPIVEMVAHVGKVSL